MAASDKFTINVRGKGGHGANPQGTVDAIVEAGALVSALQTVVSRNKVRWNLLDTISCCTVNYGCIFKFKTHSF